MKKLLDHLHRHGLRRTLGASVEHLAFRRAMWADGAFDRRYGTDTGGVIDDLGSLGVHSDNIKHGQGYQGIQLRVFGQIMKRLPLRPQGRTFVDVLLAAREGFDRSIGVEFSPELHRVALLNAEAFRARSDCRAEIDMRCIDAVQFELPPGPLVCFLYNPFDAPVLVPVLRNIERAARHAHVTLIYRNPVHRHLVDAEPWLSVHAETESFVIYNGHHPDRG
jgi:hypothetical protein